MAKVKHISTGLGIASDEEWIAEEHRVEDDDGILLISNPPSTFHKIYNIYMKKTGDKYHPVFIVESEPKS